MDRILAHILEGVKQGDWESYQEALSYIKAHFNMDDIRLFRALLSDQIRKNPSIDANYAYKMSFFVAAPYDFDSYMMYMESDRKPQERFWQPRRKKLLDVCQALQDLADDKLDELFLSMPPRVGKALANDTPILTRRGWKNHGDLVVGDEVIGMDGKFKKVIAVMPKCKLDVMVEFTNGEKIQCHENHEWLFYDRARGENRLQETKLWEKRNLDTGVEGKRGHRYILQVPNKEFVEGEDKILPMQPYSLGVWLGDGTNTNPTITGDKNDYAVIEGVIADGYNLKWSAVNKATGVMSYGFNFRPNLRTLGMCHSKRRTEKHIPEMYLTASVHQRLELLAGLIDTDGCFRQKENRYDFTTADVELKETFIELVSTFGWRCCVIEHDPTTSSSGITSTRPYWTISFNPTTIIPCRLSRKQNSEFSKQRKVAVKSIKRVPSKEGNCITVEGGMYLAGKTMIPTHNTTLAIMFTTWVMGRSPEYPKLYSSYSDTITTAFYNGVMEIITDFDTYKYKEVFPTAPIVRTNAKEETVDLQRRKHYPTLTCRSLYGTLNGACDAEKGIIISDDLIGGIEEALNKDRLISAWSKVDNNLIPRGKGGTKYLWIGTRWSVSDPQGIRISLLENDEKFKNHRWKVLSRPALDENDESNFDYDFGVGFNTDYYQKRRASFEFNNDMASWMAQYQNMPIEREGTVFAPGDMLYYNGELPEGEPDRVFMVVDPSWGGGDFVAAPVCVQFGDFIYVPDVVYDKSEKIITQPKIADFVEKHKVKAMKVEGTKMTASFGEEIDAILHQRGIRVNMQINTKHFTGRGKEQRIFDHAPSIRKHFVFLQQGKRPKEYDAFLQNVFSFKIEGKNKHDDAPDALAMADDFAFFSSTAVTVLKRPF